MNILSGAGFPAPERGWNIRRDMMLNPFASKSARSRSATRVCSFFSAIMEGNGRASVRDMIDRCAEERSKNGINDDGSMIRRDLTNWLSRWREGFWGAKVKAYRPASSLEFAYVECIEVGGIPAVPGKRWEDTYHFSRVHMLQDEVDRVLC